MGGCGEGGGEVNPRDPYLAFFFVVGCFGATAIVIGATMVATTQFMRWFEKRLYRRMERKAGEILGRTANRQAFTKTEVTGE